MTEFVASGYNKSGTTYLQQLLDSHPRVSCAPEQHTKTLIIGLSRLTKIYEEKISLFDQRTAKQGIRFKRADMMRNIMNTTIDTLFDATRNDTDQAVGFNDNWIADFLDLLHYIRPTLKFVYIVRDPRDVAVSLFHHIRRTEPHRSQGKSIDVFCRNFGSLWCKHIEIFTQFSFKRPNHIYIVKYEDLVGPEKAVHLKKVMGFLGVSANEKQCNDLLIKQSNIFKERRSSGNGFYRVGGKSSWRKELKTSTYTTIESRCSVPMRELGYLPNG
jgi:hypothetical protein